MRIVAHRGASEQYAEHTRAAYLQAVAEGADGLECDVQLTADGAVVLWHDPTVDRTSDGSGPLHERTLAQLRRLDAYSWREPALPAAYGGPGDQVLTLDELITIALEAGRPIELVIELKHPSPHTLEEAVLAVLGSRGWDPASSSIGPVTVCFMSFSPDSLERLAPSVSPGRLMLLLEDLGDDRLVADAVPGAAVTPELVGRLRALLARGVALVDQGLVLGAGPSIAHARAHPEQVRAWVEAGRLVRVWTVDDVDDARFCLSLGVQEITTNVPGRLRAALAGG